MENVSTVELLSCRDGAQTDAALELLSLLRLHVLQLFKLKYKLAPFVHTDKTGTQTGQVVHDFAKQVDRQSALAHHKQEDPNIQSQITEVENQVHAVERELLLQPLLAVKELC